MRKLATAIVLTLGALCSQAWAAGTVTNFNNVLGALAGLAQTVSPTAALPSPNVVAMGHAVIGALVYSGNVNNFNNIVDDVANVYTVASNTVGTGGSATRHLVLFYKINITNHPSGLHATFNGAGNDYPQIAWSEYAPISAFDTGTAQEQKPAPNGANQLTSGNTAALAPSTAGPDLVFAAVMNQVGASQTTFPVAGPGFTTRFADTTNGNWSLTGEDKQVASGTTAGVFSYAAASDNWITGVMAFKQAAAPQSLVCANGTTTVSIPDTQAAHTAVCAFTVTMTDGSAYTGTNTVTPGAFWELVTGTGNDTIRNINALGTNNDGTSIAALSVWQNGIYLNQNITVNIQAASVAGTPLAMGWKSLDPSGQVVFTEPTTALNVKELSLRNSTLIGGSGGKLHVYKVGAGVPCTATSALSLHNGDFDLNAALNTNQIISTTNIINGSLAVGDSVCVITFNTSGQPLGSPGPMQGTLTVTVN